MYLLTAVLFILICVIFVMFLRIFSLRNEAAFWYHRANKYRRMEHYLARRQTTKIAYKKVLHSKKIKVKHDANNNGI